MSSECHKSTEYQTQTNDDGETVAAACSALQSLFRTREAEAAKLSSEDGFLADVSFPFRQNRSTSSQENVRPASISVDEAKLRGKEDLFATATSRTHQEWIRGLVVSLLECLDEPYRSLVALCRYEVGNLATL